MSFTEETLRRFYADEIKCIFCGVLISKKETPIYEKDKKGHWFRIWNCLNCTGSYREDITELRKLGLLS